MDETHENNFGKEKKRNYNRFSTKRKGA